MQDFNMKELVLELYRNGDIPTKVWASNIYALARDTEDSVESVANAMDMLGLDGQLAYDLALELN